MHYIHIGQAPKYLSDCVSTVSAASGRYRLRATGSAAYVLPRTRTKFGERGFLHSGPAAWNTLPSDLHDITNTSTFRKRLKNVLFDYAYNRLLLALLDESDSGALQISRWLIDWLQYTELMEGMFLLFFPPPIPTALPFPTTTSSLPFPSPWCRALLNQLEGLFVECAQTCAAQNNDQYDRFSSTVWFYLLHHKFTDTDTKVQTTAWCTKCQNSWLPWILCICDYIYIYIPTRYLMFKAPMYWRWSRRRNQYTSVRDLSDVAATTPNITFLCTVLRTAILTNCLLN